MTDELKDDVQLIWDELPQNSINKTVLSFTKRLRACVKAGGGHFELISIINHCFALLNCVTTRLAPLIATPRLPWDSCNM